MKSIIAVLTLAFSVNALATEKISCTFTEPFFDMNIDLQSKKVTEVHPDWDNMKDNEPIKYVTKTIAENAVIETDFSDAFLPKYRVLTVDGQLLAELTLNMKGSDGMSDITFPLEVKYGQHWGGCKTNLLESVNPYENQ